MPLAAQITRSGLHLASKPDQAKNIRAGRSLRHPAPKISGPSVRSNEKSNIIGSASAVIPLGQRGNIGGLAPMVVPNGRAEIIAPTDTRPQYLRYRVNIFAGKGCSRPEAGIYAAHLLEQEATKGKIGTMQSTGRDEATGQELRGLVPLVDGYRRIARIEKQNSSPDYADIGML